MVSPRIPRGKVYSESKLVDECDLGNFAEIFRSLAPCPARESVERGAERGDDNHAFDWPKHGQLPYLAAYRVV